MSAAWQKLLVAVKHPNPKEKKPSDIDAKGLLQYFNQAWKKNSLPLSLHTQTENASQSENMGRDGVGVCRTDGMRFNVFELGFTLKSYRIVPIIGSDMFTPDYSQCKVHKCTVY